METTFKRFRTVATLINLIFILLAFIMYPVHDAVIISFIFLPMMIILASVTVLLPLLGQIIYCWFVYKIFLNFFLSLFPEVYIDIWFVHMITMYCVVMAFAALVIAYRSLNFNNYPMESGYDIRSGLN